MCKSRMSTNASDPTRTRSSRTDRSQPTQPPRTRSDSSGVAGYDPSTSSASSANKASTSSGGSLLSHKSLSSVRESLPENPHIYDVAEIRAATNNFLARRLSSSSSSTASWRCNLRGKEAVVFQRKFRRKIARDELKNRLSVICRSHHGSLVNLLGASVSGAGGGDQIYLVYEYVHGATLAECLRNPRNPNFTVLSSWISRIRIASDLAHGLDYIHNKTGLKIQNLVHNHIKSSGIIVTEPSYNAKICHFGTAQLCGETDELIEEREKSEELKRSDSKRLRFEGVRGYMSPEFQATGIASQQSDVFAFGVVMLELLSGEEPLKYRHDKSSGDFIRTSLIETAAVALDGGYGEMRRWMDHRLGDSFPLEVVDKLTRLALECVHADPNKRPNMGRVAGKISKLYLESENWSEIVKKPTQISVSLAPR